MAGSARTASSTHGGAFELGSMAAAAAAREAAFYTVEEVAKHRSKTDCWVIVHDGELAHDASVCISPLVRAGLFSSAPACRRGPAGVPDAPAAHQIRTIAIDIAWKCRGENMEQLG